MGALPKTKAQEHSPTLTPLIHPKLLNDKPEIINITTPLLDFHFDVIAQSQIFQVIVVFALTIIILSIVIKLYRKQQYHIYDWKTVICFNIANAKHLVTIQSQILPDDITNYKVCGGTLINNVQLKRKGIFPILNIQWNPIILHTLSKAPIHFCNEIKISWIQAYHLRSILAGKFYIIPFLRNGTGHTFTLEVDTIEINHEIKPVAIPKHSEIEMQILNSTSISQLYPKLTEEHGV
jgi:hypothetical protein